MHCHNCNVDVMGKNEKCPLCGSPLTQTSTSSEPFPKIKILSNEIIPFIKKSIFFSIVLIIVSITTNILLTPDNKWSIFVVLGVSSMWTIIYTAITKRHNIYKNILWQAFFLSVLSVLWDYLTGWLAWSISFAVPLTLMCSIIAMSIITKAKKLNYSDYIVYLIIDIIFGLIPLIFLLTNVLSYAFPSILCLVLSLIYLSSMVVFEGKNLINELKKILHL